jgi:uncharacterized protein (DUF2267 family)
MTSVEFLSHVAQRSGTTDAGGPVRAVLQSLGECLSRRQADTLADELPVSLAPWLRDGAHGQELDRFDLESRVAQRASLSRGAAVEWLFAVGRTVAEAVREDVLAPIRRDLPTDISALLEPVEPLSAPLGVHHELNRHTLADGREGYARPLYAARPDNAQSESVVHSENPHERTKLSSATGISQEREGRTLATSRK